MGLFSRKSLTPEEKDLVRELYNRSQKNPNLLSQEDVGIVNELYSRLDNEDPFRTALDQSSSGRVSNQEALEFVNKYGYEKPTRKLYKQIEGLGAEPEAPPVAAPVEAPVETPRRERPKSPEAMNTPSSMNITDVNAVLETEKKKQIIQQAIEEKNTPENIQSEFYNTYDINPFERPEEAFNLWFDIKSQENPIELAEYFENGTLDLENINESFTEALNSGKLDKELGVIRPGDELTEKPEFDKSLFQPTPEGLETLKIKEELVTRVEAMPEEKRLEFQREYTASDAFLNIFKEPWKYLPAGGFLEIGNMTHMYSLASKLEKDLANKETDPTDKSSELTKDELDTLKEYYSNEEWKSNATWPATLVEGFAIIPAFGIEVAISGFGIATLKRMGKETVKSQGKKYFSKKFRKKVFQYKLQEKLATKIVKGTAEVVATGKIGSFISRDIPVESLKLQMPGLIDFTGDTPIIYNGYGKEAADAQASLGSDIEFGGETTGKYLSLIPGKLGKLFKFLSKTKVGTATRNVYNKLPLPEKEAVMSSAVFKAFQKVNPGASSEDIVKLFNRFGYHGILEEMGEERLQEAARGLVYELSQMTDEDTDSFLKNFDNPSWEWKLPTLEQLGTEVIIFGGLGTGRKFISKAKEVHKERKFKKKAPKIQKDIEASEKIEEESKEEYKTIEKKIEDEGTKALSKKKKRRLKKLQSLDKLSDKQQKELTNLENEKRILGYASLDKEEQDKRTEIVDNRIKLNANKTLKQIIIDSPEIADEVDLSDVNLDEEIIKTRKELEDEYGPDFVTGEGMDKDTEEFKVLGYTVLANSKLKLGLGKDSTFDTVLEEYYGLVRRGGLTEEQRETYNEHYEKYKTDENYRIEINEFINDMHEKMGLKKPISDTSQILSSDKLFDKEGTSYEYKSAGEQKQDIADKVYDYVGKMFNKVFGRTDKSDEMKDVYKKVQKRKLKISSKRAQRQEERESKKKVKAKPDPKSTELPKNIKARKKEAKKVKEKKKIFNFIKNRTKKVQAKKIEKLSPVAIREVKAKIERAPEVNIPDDQREPLEILRAVLGNEQFTELTGIPSGPIANLDKIDPKIIPALTKKFPEYMASLKKIDIIDLIPVEEQNKIINQVAKVVGKKTIEPIRLKKLKPKKIPTKKKDISYQLSVLDVSKKLANPKEVTEEDKVNVAVQQGLKEVITAIEESDEGIIHESLKWYGTRFEKTLDLAGEEVRLDTPEDDLFLTTVIGIQSQGAEVQAQYNTAINSYNYYDENGTFDYRTSPNTGKPVVYSQNQKGKDVIVGGIQPGALLINHKKLESLIGKFGKEKAMNWLITKHTGKEIQEVLESVGLKRPAHIKVGGEYYGSRVFGRKIGNFISNLAGKSDVATYDRWWVRTWNRWLGTPTRMQKGEEKVQESPRGNIEEDLMNEAIDNIAKTLTEATGYKFTPPAVQAVLWYYEKELYIKNDARVPEGLDYLGAAESRAKEKGYATTPTSTKRDRRVTEQRIAKEKRDTTSLKEGIKKTGKKARQQAPQVSYELDKPKKVKIKKDKKKGIGKPGVSYQLRDARDEYGISHRPSKEGPPAHDLFKGAMVPDDVYDTPRYYIGSHPNVNPKTYKETVDAIRYLKSIKGNPEAEVTVYRAGPKRELNNGDWITLSKSYAEGHADSWNTFEGENYKLHEFKVKAKDVLWDMNSLEEWGYFPKEKAPKAKPKVSYQLTPIKALQSTKYGPKTILSTGEVFQQQKFQNFKEEVYGGLEGREFKSEDGTTVKVIKETPKMISYEIMDGPHSGVKAKAKKSVLGESLAIQTDFPYGQKHPRIGYTILTEESPEAPQVSYQLTPTQKEFFKDTKVVDSKGEPLRVYHATPKDFEAFEKGDIGFHFGTMLQAKDRKKRLEALSKHFAGYDAVGILEVYLNIKNPLRMKDVGQWNNAYGVYHHLLTHHTNQAPNFKDLPNPNNGPYDDRFKVLTDYLKSQGYDGIIYKNEHEGVVRKTNEFGSNVLDKTSMEDSYIAFDANQIKRTDNLKPTKDPRISYQLEPTGLKTLYHVTPTKNLSTIKRVGLIPFQDTLWKDNEGNRLGDGSVFAFESLEDAQDWKRKIETDPGLPFDDATILKIDNKDDRWNEDVAELPSGKIVPMNIMGPDAGRWFKRNETVKPENISVVDEAKPSFQLAPTKPELFSPALRSIENLQANSLKRQGLLKHFKRNNVPKSELDWLGVMEWARENYKPHESIPKQELIDYIKANQSKLIVTKASDEGQVNEEAAMEAGWSKTLGGKYWFNENESWMYDPADGKHTEIREDNTPLYPIPLHAPSKHEALTMVGGEDYTELLVRHPDGTFVEPHHWDIPGIIVSLRLTTRYDSKGNKILFIEEIQSDWTSRAYKLYKNEVLIKARELMSKDGYSGTQLGQPSKKYIKLAEKKVPKDFGYITRKRQAEYDKEIKEAKAEDRKLRKELLNYVREQTSAFDKVSLVEIERTIKEAFDYANASIIDSVTNRLEDKNIEEFIVYFRSEDAKGKIPSWDLNKTQAKRIMKLWAQISTPSAIVEAGPPKGFEDTPYKHTADSMPWITLGVKNAILHAVNNNFDKIAVATPEQIEDMFDVSKKISEIQYAPIDPNAKRSDADYNRFNVRVIDKEGNIVPLAPFQTPKQLEEYIGKGIVDKMMAGEGGKQLEGERGAVTQFEGYDNIMVLSGLDLRTTAKFHQTVYNATADALYKQGRRLDHKLKAGTTDIELGNISKDVALTKKHIPQDAKIKETKRGGVKRGETKTTIIMPSKTGVVTRKSIDLTDTLNDKVNKSGIPSFQLAPVGEPLDIYDDISNKDLKKFGKGERRRNQLIKGYETALIPISTLLKRINPKIYNMLLRYQFKVGTEQNKAKQFVVDMEKFVRKMPKQDQAIFKLAMLNSDGATILSLIEKYDNKQNDFLASYKKIRETLDILRDRLIENGEDVGYIEDYLPRKVLSHDKLIEYMYGNRNAKAVIEKQIEAKEKDLERPLTQSEKAELINQLIRGYSYLKSKPSYLKGRKFDKITADMIEFYEEPFIQLLNHMDRAIERIEQRTFLGFGENTDESIGEFVAGLMEQGINLTQEQQEDVFRIIKSYFDFKPTESYLSGIKTGAYGLLLGRFTNTITQVQDMVYSIYENGLGQHRTIENAVRYIFRLQRAKRKQLGIEAIGQEFKIDTKSKFNKLMDNSTNIILTVSGFKAMDGFGKSVLINSSIQKYKRKAQKNRLTKKDKAYLKSLFGKDYNDAIKDLKKKTSPSEYTDAELYIGYATILKYQPIGRTEVPLGYLENPNVGRMFYMLKTFAIKQLNVLRDDGLDIITGKQKGNKVKATRDMIYLTFLIIMAGAGGDELKDWIKQRKSTLEDKVIDNFLKLLLINKYFTDKIRRETAYKGAFKSILENGIDAVLSFPPITVAAELTDAMWVAIMKEEEDKKKSKGTRYIPWIGDVLYYRRDVEQLIEKEIPALSGIGGRGRDDYVKRSLNAIYKMAKDRQLTEDELRIYKELINDAKKYPQTKTVKGKSKRAIDVDKHRKMYKSESKKFKRVSPRDFIKKHPFISTELPTIKKALK